MHLATVCNDKDWSRLLAEVGKVAPKSRYWIGMHDRDCTGSEKDLCESDGEGEWRWVDGNVACAEYGRSPARWAVIGGKQQPDNWKGKQDCGSVQADGKWDDMGCNNKASGFVCSSMQPDVGCADDSREGFKDVTKYPNIAACYVSKRKTKGKGLVGFNVAKDSADLYCKAGWHICTGEDVNFHLKIGVEEATSFWGPWLPRDTFVVLMPPPPPPLFPAARRGHSHTDTPRLSLAILPPNDKHSPRAGPLCNGRAPGAAHHLYHLLSLRNHPTAHHRPLRLQRQQRLQRVRRHVRAPVEAGGPRRPEGLRGEGRQGPGPRVHGQGLREPQGRHRRVPAGRPAQLGQRRLHGDAEEHQRRRLLPQPRRGA